MKNISNFINSFVFDVVTDIISANSKYLLNKTLSVVSEDNDEDIKKELYGFVYDIVASKQKCKILFSKLSNDNYVMIFQMDNAPMYAFYYEKEFNIYDIYIKYNTWQPATNSIQAYFFAAFVNLVELNLPIVKMEDFDNEFNEMIGFLQFVESRNN